MPVLRHRPVRLSPAARVLLFGSLAIAAVGALIWAGLTDAQRSSTELNHLNSDVVSPLSDLLTARNSFGSAQVTFEKALKEPDPAIRGGLIASALTTYDAGLASWRRFLAVKPATDDERTLRDKVDKQLKDVRSAGENIAVSVMSSTDPSVREQYAQLIASQRSTFDQLTNDLNKIEQDYYQTSAVTRVNELYESSDRTVARSEVAGLLFVIAGAAITIVVARRASVRDKFVKEAEQERERVARRNALDANLQNALDMTDTEPHVYKVAELALKETIPDTPADLFVADDDGHLTRAVSTFPLSTGGCQVDTVDKCPALRRGQTLTFQSPNMLNACWFLQDHPAGPCSAVCVPFGGGGKTVGVLHMIGQENQPPDEEAVTAVTLIARKTGGQVSLLRAFAATQTQALTDPLTSLSNRRSLEESARQLDRDHVPYSVAYGDLDHFKRLNDSHGHAVGDRALRLFSRVLRSNVRPGDLVGRYGGEEFIVVFPNCAGPAAAQILQRVRKGLEDALNTAGDIPPFTVSFGVASTMSGRLFDDVANAADAGLLQAKNAGRDRVVVEQTPTDDREPMTGPVRMPTTKDPVTPARPSPRPRLTRPPAADEAPPPPPPPPPPPSEASGA